MAFKGEEAPLASGLELLFLIFSLSAIVLSVTVTVIVPTEAIHACCVPYFQVCTSILNNTI